MDIVDASGEIVLRDFDHAVIIKRVPGSGGTFRWQLLEELGEVNMDDPGTLTTFLRKMIPQIADTSEFYALVFNDHGGGWTGFGGDEGPTDGQYIMSVPGLLSGLK